VGEWWTVSGSPRKLSSNSHGNWVLDQIGWGKVTNLVITVGDDSDLWVELTHFLDTELGWVADVVESFDLLEMGHVVSHPKVLVVLHWCVQLLHQFRSISTLVNSTINLVLCGHELIILALDLLNNTRGMDRLLVAAPVDGGEGFGTGRLLVVVVEDGA